MININNISSIYFAGIGGIGMSALARYFNQKGIKVSGYDKTPTPLTDLLVSEGIHIHFIDDVNLIDKNVDVVVYTPAIPANHTELNFYKNNNYPLLKRSDVLGLLTKDTFNICVAGTHGKTTTSAMIAHILKDSGFGCNAFLGGIAANYNTNFWGGDSNVTVVEADEYDRSFLKLFADIAIITAMDADHLDIYGTEENMQNAFISFVNQIKANGTLIIKDNLQRIDEFKATTTLTYTAFNEKASVHVSNLKVVNGSYLFDVVINDYIIKDVLLNMGGKHNIENVTAAITVAFLLKVDEQKIKSAVANFKGVKRRFEYIIKSDDVVMIDDYAHHPEELRALINGAKELYPNKKCTVVFQPHLFSRTNDLAEGFAEVLSMADETILLPIYPARELPMPGVTSELILNKMTNAKKSVKEKGALLEWLQTNKPSLFITAGAGDIDAMLTDIKNIITNNAH
ncbi:UDP-N-acetylmuramate--L-alanine ligase [Ferruginibacter yonginensis]|uniref:UDP-N-acetylmuramate--L-alanine ligase n=1 Tax=Ferruginibacter yonginensis TaxID=1310416 RepID=A0ABV8QUR5_9BACT